MEDIQALREKYLNQDFDERPFEVDPVKSIAYARLCGETAARYLDQNHPDFQAPPTYICSLMGGRSAPADFPRFGVGMDAGKGIEPLKPIRPGVPLTGRTHLHDIYEKTGRSGRMVFMVSRIEFYDPDGVHVANSDTRIVMRERSEA
ncbi:MAG: MaoC family dehydratase N-terminal domain-containing protein [Pseudomonadales bacterium]|nr:MaoC family dehydratase N-terminal domain-containing protein [Pseudomonadales bacterium]MDP7596903.1 MaoC family dehydratase N-terminal domain-containing protein [Pseudomonadales bacterium]HJN51728.1 MaoC family dehydratase N-terminal domain-containing protein [Pseudomonadales bacterium]